MPKRSAGEDEEPAPLRSSRVRKVSERMAESMQQREDEVDVEVQQQQRPQVRAAPAAQHHAHHAAGGGHLSAAFEGEWFVLVETQPSQNEGQLSFREFWQGFDHREEGPFRTRTHAMSAAMAIVKTGDDVVEWFKGADERTRQRWETEGVWTSADLKSYDNDVEKKVIVLNEQAVKKRRGEVEANKLKANR